METLADHSPEEILASPDAAARGVKFDPKTGKVTIEIPGMGRVEWSVAMKSGAIRPAFKR